LRQLDYLSKRLYSQTRFINSLQNLTQSNEINNIWLDSIKYLESSANLINTPLDPNDTSNEALVNITGRYLVELHDVDKMDTSSLRNNLIDSNSLIQETLIQGITNIPQVTSLSKMVFSTEGKGDLFKRYFTHFELELTIDLSK
jgi:hypothetical protein